MKKENVFESDTPTLEMETQHYRQYQQGQPIPVVGGVSINPYTGFTLNPGTAPYAQQSYGSYNGLPSLPPMGQPFAGNPWSAPVQPMPAYAGPVMYPGVTGWGTPANWGWGNPTPYATNYNQGTWPTNPVSPLPGQWSGAPAAQPLTGQWNNGPATQPNWGNVRPQQSANYQPAINIADGQYMLVPNQYPQGTSKNGTSYLKNGERDFVSWFPNVNILETDRSFKIEICVPGVTKENCHISVDKNNVLRATGTRRWNQETDAVGFTRKEFNYGSFACSFVLTDNLLKEKITSSCRSGLLIISIPKKEGSEGQERSSSEISIN